MPLCARCNGKAHQFRDNMSTSVLTKVGLAQAKAEGRKTGGLCPYGWKVGGVRRGPKGPVKFLVECPEEQAVIRLVIQLRMEGRTLKGIAVELTARGIRRREGGPWDYGFICRLLKKHIASYPVGSVGAAGGQASAGAG